MCVGVCVSTTQLYAYCVFLFVCILRVHVYANNTMCVCAVSMYQYFTRACVYIDLPPRREKVVSTL